METKSEECLIIPPGVRETLLKLYDLDKPGRLDEAIDILVEWIRKQEHFIKKDIDREFLEKILISNKGSVEKTKMRLDKAFTMRTLLPDMFGTYCVKEDLQFSFIAEFPFPRQISDFNRVYFLKILGDEKLELPLETFLNWYKKVVYTLEYLIKYDYFASTVIVVDYSDIHIAKIFTKFVASSPQEIITFITEGYSVRVKGIHMVVKSKFTEVLMPLFKLIVKDKLLQRLQIHKSMDTVYDFVPKDYFPAEYGGKEKSMHELTKNWNDAISTKEFMDYVVSANEAKTDETKRSPSNFNEEYLGMAGTFRSFVVD